MFRYARRLDDDLSRWQAAGWVTPAHAAQIRADVAGRGTGVRLSTALGTLAIVLIGFAAMSFVAANWQDMSKLARLAVIFAGLWGFMGLAYVFAERGLKRFADAALLGATVLFGAGIMLIAQMYHMDGHPPDAVWLWAVGTVLVGLLLRANTVLAAALVLFSVWSFMEMTSGIRWFVDSGSTTRIHWGFLPAWASVAAGIALTRWRPGMHLLAVALSFWLISAGYMVDRGDSVRGHVPVLLAGLGLMGASIAYGPVIDRWRQLSGAMLNYGLVVAFAGAFALQFVVDRSGAWTMLFGLVTLLAIAGVLAWAWRTDNRAAMWIAYVCFTVEVFSLYIKKIGTLLGTSGFFLVTGLLVAAFAYAAWRLNDSKTEVRATS